MTEEKYNGWNIRTNRGELTDVITRKFSNENGVWLAAYVNRLTGTNEYYMDICCSEPFKLKEKYPLRSKDYHSLVNESNDVLRGIFTEIHEYVMEMISELPERSSSTALTPIFVARSLSESEGEPPRTM